MKQFLNRHHRFWLGASIILLTVAIIEGYAVYYIVCEVWRQP
jgi:hypothetical protein